MPTYNLFWRKGGTNLCCAVPEDVAVPRFLTGANWEYACSLGEAALSEFDAAAAGACVRINGFYLFHTTS